MTTSLPLSAASVAQIAINAKDLNRATAFYRDVLGLKFLFTAGTMAFFDCGGIRLMLGLPNKPELDHPSSILYFKVADINAAYEQLNSKSVSFDLKPFMVAKMPDHDLWMAFFRDTENNVMALMSEVRAS